HAGYGVPNFYKASELLNVKDTPPPPSAEDWIHIYPNPVQDELKLDIYQQSNGEVSVIITDVAGREVFSSVQDLSKGTHALSIPTAALHSGVYFFKAISG